ncbi:MAG: right-handed parallel beta-helix repeat-containing protein, partial [candidate division Zixibacteria bacterium]|nr:right-handed parallel beta-helix repeat-containing protein [Candidatus Tariuqbacter arcticus]
YYQADLQIGIYDITYSHQVYYDYSLPNQLITTPTTLQEVTLESLPPYIPLSGYIRGVLRDTLYIVIGDVFVDNGDSLVIEPGAVILFDGPYYFAIFGYLYSVGTEEDSIFFTSREFAEPWSGIGIWWLADPTSILKYCHVSGTDLAGICFSDADATVENSLIEGNNGNNAGGIHCGSPNQPVIRNCVIFNNTALNGGGVSCNDEGQPIFENCIIAQNAGGSGGGGVRCFEEARPEFIECVISNNGPYGGVFCYDESYPTFTNCTITSNWDYGADGDGINISEDSYPTVTNTIVAGNSDAGIEFNGSLNTLVSYCDIYGNRVDITGSAIPPFLGQIITVNANGDSCDIYSNIFLDPLFYSTTGDSAFYLTANSPCIDAGDPTSPLDPDGTTADIGAFYYDQSLPVIEDLTIRFSDQTAILEWSEIPAAAVYHIYCSAEPYFTISPIYLLSDVYEPYFEHQNVLLEGPLFYKITWE